MPPRGAPWGSASRSSGEVGASDASSVPAAPAAGRLMPGSANEPRKAPNARHLTSPFAGVQGRRAAWQQAGRQQPTVGSQSRRPPRHVRQRQGRDPAKQASPRTPSRPSRGNHGTSKRAPMASIHQNPSRAVAMSPARTTSSEFAHKARWTHRSAGGPCRSRRRLPGNRTNPERSSAPCLLSCARMRQGVSACPFSVAMADGQIHPFLIAGRYSQAVLV